MASSTRERAARQAYLAGVRAAVLGSLRVGSYATAPVRITSSGLGSANSDTLERYRDVRRFEGDVRRSERVALSG